MHRLVKNAGIGMTCGLLSCGSLSYNEQPPTESLQKSMATDQLFSEDYVSFEEKLLTSLPEQLGKHGLSLVVMPPSTIAEAYPESLVVTNGDGLAVEFRVDEAHSAATVSVGIFGDVNDMTDIQKIEGPDMYNGTFGHGDTDGVINLPGEVEISKDFNSALPEATEYITAKFEEIDENVYQTGDLDPENRPS